MTPDTYGHTWDLTRLDEINTIAFFRCTRCRSTKRESPDKYYGHVRDRLGTSSYPLHTPCDVIRNDYLVLALETYFHDCCRCRGRFPEAHTADRKCLYSPSSYAIRCCSQCVTVYTQRNGVDQVDCKCDAPPMEYP